MREYPNLLRLRYEHIAPAFGKRYFDEIGKDKDLFRGDVIVTEKLDGCLHYNMTIYTDRGLIISGRL